MKNIVCRHIDQQSRCCTFSTLVAMWRWCLLAGLLAATASSESNATGSSYRLFNAYQAPLSALTSPGNLYFLEFPILGNGVSPMCGDGTPFSFAFRRGSDQHVSKLLIELEGGPACWGQDTTSDGVCCSSDAALQTPWYHFYTQQENSSLPIDKFPQLNTCAGITPGFAQMGSQELFRRDNKEDQHPADIPVFLRNDAATFGNPDEWWNVLGGNYSHVSDWSYILIPHCTLDWHLGHQERPQSFQCDKNLSEDSNGNSSVSNDTIREVYHRGGTNLEAVVEWVQAQFPQGLDALVVGSGGKVGGCGRAADASSIASSIVASKLSSHNAPGSDSLVIAEGSDLWKSDLPDDNDLANRWNAADIPEGGSLVEGLKDWLQASPQSLQVAWLASAGGTAGKAEQSLMENLEESKGESFHVLQAPPSDHQQWCPRFAFPKESSTPTFASFLQHIVQSISWNVASSNDMSVEDDFESTDDSFHLSFLSISLMIIAVVILIWIVYFAVNYNQNRRGQPSVPSPSDLWFRALTRYPLIFLLVSVLIPLSLSFAAYAKSGYQVPVNLDFDSYLEINTPLENVRRAYDKARGHQKESLTLEAENCELLSEGAETQPSFLDRRELLDDSTFTFHIEHNVSLEDLEPDHRELYGSNMLYYSGGEAIAIMYQNRNGGNVFEQDVLRDIFEFEQAIYRFPGFASYCFGFGPGRCIPIDSLVTHFFPEGYLVSDIDSVVRSFLGNQPALWKLDQNFGPDNLQSEVIRSFIFLQDLGGDQSAAHPFLESLYREYFWKVDQTNTHTAMIHTWDNEHLKKVEANDALKHDTLWSIGSLCFIALMIHFKVRSLFVVFFSMVGLILAFTASFYWASVHFAIESATLLWVAGLYVMLGIGADDIFLMVDSFEHTKIQTGAISQHNDKEASTESSKEAQLSLLRERMKEAYRKAGSMMLVSSVTTAICFFSNAFGILVVIQEFGIFMGMVVLMNFLHVMTILPSAILVNEFYVAPLQQRLLKWFKTSFRKNDLKARDVIHESDGGDSHFGTNEGSSLENTSQMNRMDRWLVTKYAPFINRRAVIAVVLTFSLAAILGSLGVAKFAMSDGNIVLFTDKYNLGRLTIVTDTYFNKDIKKTIEENRETSTKPPESTPNSGGQGSSSGVTLPESTTQGGPLGNENSGANAAEGSNDGSTSESATSPSTGSTSSGNSVTGGVPSVPAPQPAPQQDFDEAITTAPVSAAPLGPNSGLDLRRRETIFVNLIWGVDADEQGSQLWKVRRNNNHFAKFGDDNIRSSSFDPSVPTNQEALLKTIQMARMDKALNVQPDKITWIEMLRDFTVDIGIGFPLPKELFIGYIEILKQRDTKFADLVSRELGTQSPGLAGDFTYTSITLEVDAVQNESLSLSESVYRQWNAFATEVNANSPTDVPDMVAQSRIFLDAYRVETTVESTVATWFIANGLCLLVILLFTRNLALSLMVMGTISLIFLCLGGIIFSMFKIPFGAVEALGISIFIGLSANYSLHVVHAYHHAKGDTRAAKVAEAIFAVGGPIVASALSTIGASAFLFGCRTWVFVELGILVCSITTMALLYSMTFLLAWLTLAGPRPFERNGKQVHAWDIHALCCSKIWCHSTADACENVCQADDELDGECSFRYPKSSSRIDTIDSDNRSSNDSSEEIQDRGDDSDYSIEVVDDLCGATMDIHEQNSDDHSIMVVDE